MIFSALLLIVSIISLGLQGLKLGIDFTGGTLIEVGYQQTADLEDIRTKLASANLYGHKCTVLWIGHRGTNTVRTSVYFIC